MTSYICWDGKQVDLTDHPDLDALFVIDTAYGKNTNLRYGNYKYGKWPPIPFKDFPAEFKVSMLLLGVSP